jgi:hypothetical protein
MKFASHSLAIQQRLFLYKTKLESNGFTGTAKRKLAITRGADYALLPSPPLPFNMLPIAAQHRARAKSHPTLNCLQVMMSFREFVNK